MVLVILSRSYHRGSNPCKALYAASSRAAAFVPARPLLCSIPPTVSQLVLVNSGHVIQETDFAQWIATNSRSICRNNQYPPDAVGGQRCGGFVGSLCQ